MKQMLESFRRALWAEGTLRLHGNGTVMESHTQSFPSPGGQMPTVPLLFSVATSLISLSLKTGLANVPELCNRDLVWPFQAGPLSEQLSSSVQLPSIDKNSKQVYVGSEVHLQSCRCWRMMDSTPSLFSQPKALGNASAKGIQGGRQMK